MLRADFCAERRALNATTMGNGEGLDAMKVRELIGHLQNADPDATVMLVSYDAPEADAEAVRSVRLDEKTWTYERGLSKGRPYESLYRGERHSELRYDCENMIYENVSVILLAT
ncbi:hypothetical protein [Paraburkholderia graminis]|uniref:hypothetical protein n=1 Tax=Paraburkholderia graminis TaxID=60548 RepID=UPI0038BDF67F